MTKPTWCQIGVSYNKACLSSVGKKREASMWFEWKRGTVCWGLAASVIRQGQEKSHLNSESSFANICRSFQSYCLKCHFVDALFFFNVSFLFASVFFPQNFGIPQTQLCSSHNFFTTSLFGAVLLLLCVQMIFYRRYHTSSHCIFCACYLCYLLLPCIIFTLL